MCFLIAVFNSLRYRFVLRTVTSHEESNELKLAWPYNRCRVQADSKVSPIHTIHICILGWRPRNT